MIFSKRRLIARGQGDTGDPRNSETPKKLEMLAAASAMQ